MKRVDLHTHSSASDGLFPPREVIRRAHGVGLAGVALTDHDTLAGLGEAAQIAQHLGLTFVPGCEISVAWRGRDIHLLAYFVDPGHPSLQALLAGLHASRRARAREMIRRLHLLGVPLAEEAVRAEAADSHSVGRLHVARALRAGGYVRSLDEAFRLFIGTDRPAFVPKETPAVERVIETVWEAGAVPVLAHPGLYRLGELERQVAEWELAGIEVYHPSHDPETERRLRNWAVREGWLITGGSDWHGASQPAAYLGCRSVGREVIAALRGRRRCAS